jgi:3-oxoacyl-[acyl-carrier protein] reductase
VANSLVPDDLHDGVLGEADAAADKPPRLAIGAAILQPENCGRDIGQCGCTIWNNERRPIGIEYLGGVVIVTNGALVQAAFDPIVRLALPALTDLVVPAMKAARWGRIISISGVLVAPKLNAAAPAKAALASWSRTLSFELGGCGITVNTIAPGRINTAQIQKLHPTEQSRADYIKQNIPAGYFGEPYDIGHLVAFLASPLARYINGAAIPVDGGAVRRAL